MFSAISQEAYKTENHLAPFIGHVQMLTLGFIVMVIAHHIPYRFFRMLYIIFLPITAVLLIMLPFVGIEVNGAIRAIKILGFEFQPLELAKFSVILFIVDMLARNQKRRTKCRQSIFPNFGSFGTILLPYCTPKFIYGSNVIWCWHIAYGYWKNFIC